MLDPVQLEKILAVPRLFGLIGYPLSHSFSKKYFSEKFERENISGCLYELFPLERIGEFPSLLAALPNLCGINVTIPYKEQVIPFLDELDTEAAAIGAVNTILIQDGRRKGFNTDVIGFRESLLTLLGHRREQVDHALVLGTGGAAKGVIYVLEKLGMLVTVVSREAGKSDLAYEQVDAACMQAHQLIVNTTPLGMSPHLNTFPAIPYDQITPDHFLFDLVYNPSETVFMREGRSRGASVMNGLEMLIGQAEAAWKIWNA